MASLACDLPENSPTSVPFETLVAQGVAATLTAEAPLPQVVTVAPTTAPAPTVLVTIPPGATPAATPASLPTQVVPTSAFFTDAEYELSQERIIGRYAVRVWRNRASRTGGSGVDQIATIAQSGAPQIQVDFFSALDPLTGSDITADSTPEVILHTYSGGAHCCFSTLIYSLADTPQKLLESRPSNCPGTLTDINGDQVYELVTCDDSFAYAFCPYASSPSVSAILAFQPGQGYLPASPRFPEQYTEAISTHTTLAEQGKAGEMGEWDSTTKCSVLPLILDLLYSGQTEKAWSEFNRLYTFPDAQTFRMEIEQTVGQSPLYTAG